MSFVTTVPNLIDMAAGDLAAGGGVTMDMSDLIFVNMGIGYQLGFQKVPQTGVNLDNKTRYLRVALGGGLRF